MTTSGSDTFNPPGVDIFTNALRNVRAIDISETPSSAMLSVCQTAANAMLKEWEARGIHVWTEEEAILFLQPGQYRYLLGGSSTDHCCDAYSYASTSLAVNAAASATTVTVADVTGITDAQHIGIVLDTSTVFWTTVSGAPVGSVVTLASALPSSAAAANYVWAYTSDITRPLKVPAGRQLAFNGLRETPMTVLSRKDYMNLPQKNQLGSPTQFFYAPKRDDGVMNVWPNPQIVGAVYALGMRFTWYRQLQVFVSQTDTADIPQEWASAIEWNLSKELTAKFPVSDRLYNRVLTMAAEKMDIVTSFDRESEPIQFGVSFDDNTR